MGKRRKRRDHDGLPQDLWDDVRSFLTLREISRLRCVSKSFSRVQNVRTSVFALPPPGAPFGTIVRLDIDDYLDTQADAQRLSQVLRDSPKLEVLGLNYSLHALQVDFTYTSALREIDLGATLVDFVNLNLSSLESMRSVLNYPGFLPLVTRSHQTLKRLEIRCESIPGGVLPEFPELTELRFHAGSEEVLSEFLLRVPNLEILQIHGHIDLFPTIDFERHKSLRELHLVSTTPTFQNLDQSNLESFIVSRNVWELFWRPEFLKTLRRLEVCDCEFNDFSWLEECVRCILEGRMHYLLFDVEGFLQVRITEGNIEILGGSRDRLLDSHHYAVHRDIGFVEILRQVHPVRWVLAPDNMGSRNAALQVLLQSRAFSFEDIRKMILDSE